MNFLANPAIFLCTVYKVCCLQILNTLNCFKLFCFHRSYFGIIFLWLHCHTVTRWLVRSTVWWEVLVWFWSALYGCVNNVYTTRGTSQYWNVNSGENSGGPRRGKSVLRTLFLRVLQYCLLRVLFLAVDPFFFLYLLVKFRLFWSTRINKKDKSIFCALNQNQIQTQF